MSNINHFQVTLQTRFGGSGVSGFIFDIVTSDPAIRTATDMENALRPFLSGFTRIGAELQPEDSKSRMNLARSLSETPFTRALGKFKPEELDVLRTKLTLKPEQWTPGDSATALREGWGVFDSGELRIERHDAAEMFEDDEAAWRFVVEMAAAGSVIHKKALRCISRAEVERIAMALKVNVDRILVFATPIETAPA